MDDLSLSVHAAMDDLQIPLLSHGEEGDPADTAVIGPATTPPGAVDEGIENLPFPGDDDSSQTIISTAGDDVMDPATTVAAGGRNYFREFMTEGKKVWLLAGPASLTCLCQYSLGAITQVMVGQIGTRELAAVSVENSVIADFSFGVMLGMASALETLCGQAFGAGQLNMLGVYMQRSLVILNMTAFVLMFFYIYAYQWLKLVGQTDEISKAAGTFAIWMIPQLYAYAANFPLSKFLQAQSKVMAMTVISVVALILHTFFSWLFILKMGWGLAGAAIVLNTSWWLIVVTQLVYIMSGTCGAAWSGFTWDAFSHMWSFLKLSVASGIMLCLEIWYCTGLIMFAGYLKNAEISVDALSVCMNILGWTVMFSVGCNAAVSVRVSNELGAANPRVAKLSVLVVVITSTLIGLGLSVILLIARKEYAYLFSESAEVRDIVYDLTPLLAISIVINNVQPVLSGVAVGAGWQSTVAFVNITSYYFFGIPLGIILGHILDMGVKGIWYGMLSGIVVQTCTLFWMVYKTDWNKEASLAEHRIRELGGDIQTPTESGTVAEKRIEEV